MLRPYSKIAALMAVLLMLAMAALVCQAQFTALVAGNVVVPNWQGTPPADLLRGLHVRIISTDDDNGSVRPDEVQTDAAGYFSDNVQKGYIKIRVTGRKDGSPGPGQSTVLFGEYPVNGPVRVATKGTLTINPSLPAKATVTSAKAKNSDGRAPGSDHKTVQLIAFVIPSRTYRTISVDDGNEDSRNFVRIKIIDVNGNSINDVSVTTVDADSFKEQDYSPDPGTSEFTFKVQENSALVVKVESPRLATRTLLLYRRGGGVELYDESSTSLGRVANIKLQTPDKSSFASLDVTHIVNVDTSRRLFLETELIDRLPLGLFTNPDVVVSLAPGYAPPPEAFGHIGPSLSPGIGTPGAFSLNGIRSRENNFNIDGSDYNDEEFGVRRQGFVTTFPQPLDSIMEYQAITAAADARFGRGLGGDINVLSRPGGPQSHFAIYASGTGGRLWSRDFFQLKDNFYTGSFRSHVPITADGTTSGTPVQFLLDPSYHGPISVADGFGYQSNPLQLPVLHQRISFGIAGGGRLGVHGGPYGFASIEREIDNSTRQDSFSVPTVKQRGIMDNGDTGGVDPNTGLQYYPSSPSGDAMFSVIPFPNNPLGPFGTNTFTSVLPDSAAGYVYSARLDGDRRMLGRDNVLSVRINDTNDHTDIPSIGDAIYSSMRVGARTTNIAAFMTTRISTPFFNTLRMSYGESSIGFAAIGNANLIPSDAITSGDDAPLLLNAPLILNVTEPIMHGETGQPTYTSLFGPEHSEMTSGPIGQIHILGFSAVGVDVYHFPQTRHDHTFQYADQLSFSKGRHNAYFGFDARSVTVDSNEDRDARTLAEFHGAPGFPSAVGLAAGGIPTGMYETLALTPEGYIKLEDLRAGLFAQDYFRLLPNITLNGGVRAELGTLPNADSRLNQAFSANVFSSQLSAAVNDCTSELKYPFDEACLQYAADIGKNFGGSFKQVFGSGIKGIAPRAGLAWDLNGAGKTLIKMGIGEYLSAFPAVVIDETRSAFDQFLPVNSAFAAEPFQLPNPANPASIYAVFGAPQLPIQPGTTNLLIQNSNPVFTLATHLLALRPVLPSQLRESYSYQVAVAVEQKVMNGAEAGVAYVGTFGRHLLRVESPNGGPGELMSEFTGLRRIVTGFPWLDFNEPQPQSVAPEKFASSSSSSYNSFQVSLTRASGGHLRGGVSFTYSHAIDDASDFFDTAGEYAVPAWTDEQGERGNAAFDMPFRTSGYWSWDLPSVGKKLLLNGWVLSGIAVKQSGQPYTVNSAIDLNQDGNATDRPVSSSGLDVHPKGYPRQVQVVITEPLSQWAYPGDGGNEQGSISRNTFRSEGLVNVDLRIERTLHWMGRGRWKLYCDSINALNHSNFGIPVRFLEAPAFGRSTSTITSPRSFQFGLTIER